MVGLFTLWKKKNEVGQKYSYPSKVANHKPLIGKRHDDLFDDIIGFEDVEDLFYMAIKADKPVHLLLVGPPASAKSLFMRSFTKLELE